MRLTTVLCIFAATLNNNALANPGAANLKNLTSSDICRLPQVSLYINDVRDTTIDTKMTNKIREVNKNFKKLLPNVAKKTCSIQCLFTVEALEFKYGYAYTYTFEVLAKNGFIETSSGSSVIQAPSIYILTGIGVVGDKNKLKEKSISTLSEYMTSFIRDWNLNK